MAQGGVGYWGNRYWHPNWWHPEWWAEQGSGAAPITAGGVVLACAARGDELLALSSLATLEMRAGALGDWTTNAMAGDDIRLRFPYHT